MSVRIAGAKLSIVLFIGIAHADPTPDPETARLQAETARLQAESGRYTAETALITAKNARLAAEFGTPAAGKDGTINNPEKFLAMGQWTLGLATRSAAASVVSKAWAALNEKCAKPMPYLVTSVEDRRSAEAAAAIVQDKLVAFTELLKPADESKSPTPTSLLSSVDAVRGIVGTLDTLIALVRTDYTFSDLTGKESDLSLRIEVANLLSEHISASETASRLEVRSTPPAHSESEIESESRIEIDGLAGPSGRPPLLAAYDKFLSARQYGSAKYASAETNAKTDKEKAELAAMKALLDAAAAFDLALSTPVSGQIPIVSFALASAQSGKDRCVVFVKFGSYGASLVTRKRLLSRNDAVTAIAGGIVQTAFFDSLGNLVAAHIVRIDERIGGKLSEIVDEAHPLSKRHGD